MIPGSVVKSLQAFCLLGFTALASGAAAQSIVSGKLSDAPQEAMRQIFGTVSKEAVEVVPHYYRGDPNYPDGATFYMRAAEGPLCRARVVRVRRPDFENAYLPETYDVYFAPDPALAGCSGPVSKRNFFTVETWPVRDDAQGDYLNSARRGLAAEARPLLQALIARAGSDAPLGFAVEAQCIDPRPNYYPQCAPAGLQSQLAQLKLDDLTDVRDLGWSDTEHAETKIYELSVGRKSGGHWLLRVEFDAISAIKKVQMRWMDTRPPH